MIGAEIERLLAELTPRPIWFRPRDEQRASAATKRISPPGSTACSVCAAQRRATRQPAPIRTVLDAALRRTQAVAEAAVTLRWRNPNRALLTEALALRLARG
jgi:hypothetical protein